MASSLIWASVNPSNIKAKSPSALRYQSLPSKKFETVAAVGCRSSNTAEGAAAASSMRKVQLVSLAASAAVILCSSPGNYLSTLSFALVFYGCF